MVFRLQPALPPQAVKTYGIHAPIETHTREGRCEEVNCRAHSGGWETLVNESTDIGSKQAHYIRTRSGRRFTETLDAGVTTFRFPSGQQCFADHRVSLDRPEIYIVRGGDHRGNPRGDNHVHTSPDAWVNDFATHQDNINRTING